jgi:aminoglycoside phosphotransferase (APT) family kinase protein
LDGGSSQHNGQRGKTSTRDPATGAIARAPQIVLRAAIMNMPQLGKRLGSGKEAEVFEYLEVSGHGTLVVKLYRTTAPKRSAFREAAILALVEQLGLPVPAVWGVRQIHNRWGVTMARADGPTLADAMNRQPNLLPAYLMGMAQLQVRVHGHPGTHLADLKAKLAANIRQAKMLGETRQNALLDGLAMLPQGDRLCHGDFHPMNIMGPPGRELLVDWLDASRGEPAADVCRSYVLIRSFAPELASAYVDAYARVSGEDRQGIYRWLRYVAAARLAEGVASEVDGLMEIVDSA